MTDTDTKRVETLSFEKAKALLLNRLENSKLAAVAPVVAKATIQEEYTPYCFPDKNRELFVVAEPWVATLIIAIATNTVDFWPDMYPAPVAGYKTTDENPSPLPFVLTDAGLGVNSDGIVYTRRKIAYSADVIKEIL